MAGKARAMSDDRPSPYYTRRKRGSPFCRWTAVALGIGSLALPGLAGAEMPATHAASAPFAAPNTPFILTRELRRSLFDGKEVVVRRVYRIHFMPDGAGYRVEGDLIDVTVDVPAKLAALADVERRRVQTGLFPMHLDANGRLQELNTPPDHGTAERAWSISGEMIDGVHLDDTARADIRNFTRDALAGGSEDHWPADLFHPVCGLRSDTSHFDAPGGGGSGSITVSIDAGCDSHGLLKSLERMVTTSTGSEKRMTRELWTLAAGLGILPKDPSEH